MQSSPSVQATPSYKKQFNRTVGKSLNQVQVPKSKYDGPLKAANNAKLLNKQNELELYAFSTRGTKMSKKKEGFFREPEAVARFAKH